MAFHNLLFKLNDTQRTHIYFTHVWQMKIYQGR